MESVISQKDKKNVIHEGYRLRQDRMLSDGSVSWRCVLKSCRGRIRVDATDSVTKVNDHDHPPVPEEIVATQVVAEMRNRADDCSYLRDDSKT